jgi:hypothetical protein
MINLFLIEIEDVDCVGFLLQEILMSPVNVLMVIHCLIPNSNPKSPFNSSENGKYWGYSAFWNALCIKYQLRDFFPHDLSGIEWGYK